MGDTTWNSPLIFGVVKIVAIISSVVLEKYLISIIFCWLLGKDFELGLNFFPWLSILPHSMYRR